MTNLFLSRGSGSEAVTELLADALRRAGHEPILFAPEIGPQASRMRMRGHRVVDRLSGVVAPPDVIHAQHATPALMAMAAFPGVPTVFASHSSIFEVEAPRPHPQIRRVTAVDERGQERCIGCGFAPGLVEIVPNAVDLDRFRPRQPLPAQPRRALAIAKIPGHLPAIRAACAAKGIALDEVGPATGRVSDRLEDELPNYDIVFASGRSALEAAAVGCAVVLVDGTGMAGLLTTANLGGLRAANFGVRILTAPVDPDSVGQAIAAYDPEDAALVTARIRANASADAYAAAYLRLYEAAIADPPPADPAAIAAATARWLEDLLPTSADRPWRSVAAEIGGFVAERDAAALSAVLARIEELPSLRAFRAASRVYRRVVPLGIRMKLRRLRGLG